MEGAPCGAGRGEEEREVAQSGEAASWEGASRVLELPLGCQSGWLGWLDEAGT